MLFFASALLACAASSDPDVPYAAMLQHLVAPQGPLDADDNTHGISVGAAFDDSIKRAGGLLGSSDSSVAAAAEQLAAERALTERVSIDAASCVRPPERAVAADFADGSATAAIRFFGTADSTGRAVRAVADRAAALQAAAGPSGLADPPSWEGAAAERAGAVLAADSSASRAVSVSTGTAGVVRGTNDFAVIDRTTACYAGYASSLSWEGESKDAVYLTSPSTSRSLGTSVFWQTMMALAALLYAAALCPNDTAQRAPVIPAATPQDGAATRRTSRRAAIKCTATGAAELRDANMLAAMARARYMQEYNTDPSFQGGVLFYPGGAGHQSVAAAEAEAASWDRARREASKRVAAAALHASRRAAEQEAAQDAAARSRAQPRCAEIEASRATMWNDWSTPAERAATELAAAAERAVSGTNTNAAAAAQGTTAVTRAAAARAALERRSAESAGSRATVWDDWSSPAEHAAAALAAAAKRATRVTATSTAAPAQGTAAGTSTSAAAATERAVAETSAATAAPGAATDASAPAATERAVADMSAAPERAVAETSAAIAMGRATPPAVRTVPETSADAANGAAAISADAERTTSEVSAASAAQGTAAMASVAAATERTAIEARAAANAQGTAAMASAAAAATECAASKGTAANDTAAEAPRMCSMLLPCAASIEPSRMTQASPIGQSDRDATIPSRLQAERATAAAPPAYAVTHRRGRRGGRRGQRAHRAAARLAIRPSAQLQCALPQCATATRCAATNVRPTTTERTAAVTRAATPAVTMSATIAVSAAEHADAVARMCAAAPAACAAYGVSAAERAIAAAPATCAAYGVSAAERAATVASAAAPAEYTATGANATIAERAATAASAAAAHFLQLRWDEARLPVASTLDPRAAVFSALALAARLVRRLSRTSCVCWRGPWPSMTPLLPVCDLSCASCAPCV